MERCLNKYIQHIKYALITLRAVFTVYYLTDMVISGQEQMMAVSQDILKVPRETFHRVAVLAIVITIILEMLFTFIYMWSVYYEIFGGVVVMTTFCFVAFLFDLGYIDNQVSWSHMGEMTLAILVIITGFLFVYAMSTRIEQLDNNIRPTGPVPSGTGERRPHTLEATVGLE